MGKCQSRTHSQGFTFLSDNTLCRQNIYASFVFITFTYRYYGMKKQSTAAASLAPPTASTSGKVSSNTTASTASSMPKKMVAKPIITVTEFTPGNTPTDKVRSIVIQFDPFCVHLRYYGPFDPFWGSILWVSLSNFSSF